MNKKFNNLFLSLFSISIIYFMLFAAFYLVCFLDKDGLYKLIIKNETYKNLPFTLSDFDLKNLSRELMQYISGKLQFLETKVTINGIITDFYSLRSKIHMGDVRNLIINFRNVSFVAIIICIFSLFKIQKLDEPIEKLKSSYLKTLLVVGILLIALIIYASNNFDAFFIKFHETLFTNDLWLLDPSEDYIICLLPEKIFMIYGLRIGIAMLVALALPYLFLQILSRIQLHQEAK
jgi:integral membrane protein (TIGR01906 family)